MIHQIADAEALAGAINRRQRLPRRLGRVIGFRRPQTVVAVAASRFERLAKIAKQGLATTAVQFAVAQHGVELAAFDPLALVTGLAGMVLLQSLAQRSLESVWVLHGGLRYGWSELENGLSLALVGVGAAVVQGGLVRRIVPRLGEPRALRLGLAISVVALVLYGLAARSWMLLAVIPLASFGYIATPAYLGLVTGAVPPERQGAVQGALASLQSLASIVAPLASTWLFAIGSDGTLGLSLPGLPFFAAAGLVLLALLVATVTLRRHPATEGSGVSTSSG